MLASVFWSPMLVLCSAFSRYLPSVALHFWPSCFFMMVGPRPWLKSGLFYFLFVFILCVKEILTK